jgi:hypothetical protein
MKIDIKFRLLILSLLLTSSGVLLANDVKFTASAPSTVIADKPFQGRSGSRKKDGRRKRH